MPSMCRLAAAAAAAVSLAACASGAARPATAPTAQADTSKKDLPWKPWAEVTKDAQQLRGLFTGYLKRDNAYLAIKPDQFDRDYLLVAQLAQGLGDYGLDGGSSLRSDLVQFHRTGTKVELRLVNPYLTATPGTPMARTVAYSFGGSVAYAFPIASVRDTTNEVLIDLTPFLLSDWADVGSFFDFFVQALSLRGGVSLDKERSAFQGMRMFPANVELDARISFLASKPLGIATVPDYRYIPMTLHYSLLELPATPMRPRVADDRVGYFISAMMDFSRDTSETFFVRYVNRWRLEKRDPSAAVSDPVKPITYYLDRTIPLEWRPYVRAGILEWNRAFEDAGLTSAIQVLDAPDDTLWSAEDARYSTVRWMANFNWVYAIGPSDVDPRTGEILNADILIAASLVPYWQGEYREYAGPETMTRAVFQEDSLLRADPTGRRLRQCRYAAGLSRYGTLLRATLAASGVIAPGAPVPREYIGQALKELVMHEVGHTLGLRHNFRGTTAIPAASLTDRRFTAANGTSASVMDYNPPAIALDRGRQGDYYSTTIGTYDRWAIRYGYTAVGGDSPDAERPSLARIAGEAADPNHVYATDEDAGFAGFGLDPNVTRWDQTTDPLAWAKDQVTLINRLFDSLETRLVAPGEGYPKLRGGFIDLLFQRWYATIVTTKYLSGVYTARDHRGDPNARPPFTAVPAEKQREALAFIAAAGLGEDVYRFRPELLNRLAPSRWWHWGQNPFSQGRIDFPLHDWAYSFQSILVSLLLDPGVLARIRDNELRATPGERVVTIPDVLTTLTNAIWAEAGRGRNVASIRRDLQRMYLGELLQLHVSPAPGTPDDARAIARVTLVELNGRLTRALAAGRLDAYTRAHYADARVKIEQALRAQAVVPASQLR
ncbi:MAG: zinc-dependent metalloprotease [Gemmatimonadales bacterium]